MPIFEYECTHCAACAEFLVGVNQTKAAIVCPSCGSTKMRKKISSGHVSTGSKSKQEFCSQKGPSCSTPSCMYGGGCCQ